MVTDPALLDLKLDFEALNPEEYVQNDYNGYL
jgi:hypothetical protein